MELTAKRLRELMNYDAEIGVFTWKKPRPGARHKSGLIAGSPLKAGYLQIGIDGRKYRANRLAWLFVHGRWPSATIDHKNGNAFDNSLSNLREATHRENQQNAKRRSDSVSGLKGVGWIPGAKKWRARIKVDGREVSLGQFNSAAEAYVAYCNAAEKYHGKFSRFA